MASFLTNADETGQSVPSFVKPQSAGVEPNRGLGSLFSGVADTAKMAIDTVDTTIKNVIKDNLVAGVDTKRDQLIRDRQDVADANAAKPAGLQEGLDRMARAKSAVQYGTMNDSYRDIVYDSIARDLRYKYAGYREYIDDYMHKLTGIQPANKLVEDLRIEATKNMGSEDKSYDQWVKHAVDNGVDVPALQKANGGKTVPVEYLQSLIANKKGEEARRSAAQADLTINKGTSEQVVRDGLPRVKEMLDQNDVASRSTALQSIGLTPDKLKQLAIDYQSNPALVTPEVEKQMRTAVGSYLQQAEVADRAFLTTAPPTGGKSLQVSYGFDKQHVDDLITQKKADREAFFKPLLDKDFGSFEALTRNLNASKLGEEARLLVGENTRVYAAVSRTLGPQVAAQMLADPSRNVGVMKDIEKTMGQTQAMMIANGDTGSIAEADAAMRRSLKQNGNPNSVNPANPTNWSIEKLIDTASDKNALPLARNNSLQGIFNDKNVGWTANLVVKNGNSIDDTASANLRVQTYQKFTTKEMQNAVVEASRFNPKIQENYVNYAVNTGIALGKQTLDNVKEKIINRDGFAQINFNPETATFSFAERTPSPETMKKYNTGSVGLADTQKNTDLINARNLTNQLNDITRQIKPALKMGGSKDISGELALRFNQFGFNINALRPAKDGKLQGSLSSQSSPSKLGAGDIGALQDALNENNTMENQLQKDIATNPRSRASEVTPPWTYDQTTTGIARQYVETQQLLAADPNNEDLKKEMQAAVEAMKTHILKGPEGHNKPK